MKSNMLAVALLMIVCGLAVMIARKSWQYAPYLAVVLLAIAASAVNPLPWFGQ